MSKSNAPPTSTPTSTQAPLTPETLPIGVAADELDVETLVAFETPPEQIVATKHVAVRAHPAAPNPPNPDTMGGYYF